MILLAGECTQSFLFLIRLICFHFLKFIADFHIIGKIIVDPAFNKCKQSVDRILKCFIILTAFRRIDHFNQRFKVLFFRRIDRKDHSDICSVKQLFCLYPEVIAAVLLRTLRIPNENVHKFQNILFSVLFGDIGKGIVVHGLAEINGIEHLDSVRLIG